VAPKLKLQLYHDRVHKIRDSALAAKDDQAVTGIHWNSPNYSTSAVKLTSTATNRLLLEGGWSSTIERYNTIYQSGLEQPYYTPLWYTLVARNNTDDSNYTVAPSNEGRQYPDRYNWQGSASYVTGTHNIKAGFLYSWGVFNLGNYRNGDMIQQYRTVGGVPNTPYQVTLYPTDPRYANVLNYNADFYLQDSWTHKRVTLTGGIRYDLLRESAGGQPAQQGTFEVIPAFSDVMMPKQTNWSPRVSGVMDIFGNGKTALRAGFNHVTASATDSLANSQNPAIGNTASIPWNDVNGDNRAQYTVTALPGGGVQGCDYGANGVQGCEINFQKLPGGFGAIAIGNQLDPALARPYFNQTNVGVSQELTHGVSVSAEWYRTDGKNIQATKNLTRVVDGLTDYSKNLNYQSFTVYSPIDGHPVPMYDVASQAVLNATAKNYTFTNASLSSTYNGFDFGFNARLPRGGRLFGGTTTERTQTNNCDLGIDNPNQLLYCDTTSLGQGYTIPWKTQIKLSGTYPTPWWGLIANGSYQGLPGYNIARTTYTITKASTYVTCPGNSAAAGCVPGQVINPNIVSTSVSVPLDPTGVTLTPRTNQVDFGVAKRLKFGRVRFDPRIDLFNAFNSYAYYSVVSTSFSPVKDASQANPALSPALPANAAGTQYTAYHQPARFLQGRILKIGFNASW